MFIEALLLNATVTFAFSLASRCYGLASSSPPTGGSHTPEGSGTAPANVAFAATVLIIEFQHKLWWSDLGKRTESAIWRMRELSSRGTTTKKYKSVCFISESFNEHQI